jgi:hypothetical protein
MSKRRKRRREKIGQRARWYNAPQGKQIQLACGSVVMRVGGDIVEIPRVVYRVGLPPEDHPKQP